MNDVQSIWSIIIVIVWAISLYHLWRIGYKAGHASGLAQGNKIGVSTTLEVLEQHNILDVKQYEILLKKMKGEA